MRTLLGVVTVLASGWFAFVFFQVRRRRAFLSVARHDLPALRRAITQRVLQNPSEKTARFLARDPLGWPISILRVETANHNATLAMLYVSGLPLVALLIVSGIVGWRWLLATLAVAIVASVIPLTDRWKQISFDHLVVIATILHQWRGEGREECENWVRQGSDNWIQTTYSLGALYQIVKSAELEAD
jgi:hypothetical protein